MKVTKEIDLGSLPVTPTDFKFNEHDIERTNVNRDESEQAGLEEPFSPQVESEPTVLQEELKDLDLLQDHCLCSSYLHTELAAPLSKIP